MRSARRISSRAGTWRQSAGKRPPRRYSGMLQYTTSEFGRFRLQYIRDDSYGGAGGNQYVLQYTVSLGPHGAHAY